MGAQPVQDECRTMAGLVLDVIILVDVQEEDAGC